MARTEPRRVVEWRFGGHPDDLAAWYSAPTMVHVYVDLRTPDTPPGHWHRVWTVTRSWVEAHLPGPGESVSVPPLLIVAVGSPEELRWRIDGLVQDGGWRVIIQSAALVSPGHEEVEW